MTCGRWAAVLAGIVLLAPGLCFFGFGSYFMTDKSSVGPGLLFIAIAIGLFGLACWLLFKVAREPKPSLKDPIGESSTKEPPKGS